MKPLIIKFLILSGILAIALATDAIASELMLEQQLMDAHVPEYQFQIVGTYYHDTHSFTEGLFFQNGIIYESTGLYGQSKLRKYELNSAKILKEYPLQRAYFGEGMTILGEQLYQLTWREHTGFIYDKNSFQMKNTFSFANEGWGLTSDGLQLIMSNGSSTLTFLDPLTLKPMRLLSVNLSGKKVYSLNELEYIDGMIYANVWPTSLIVIISPQTGNVTGWVNIKTLNPVASCFECVANGIAYNDKDKNIIVTGKKWPLMYAIKLSAPHSGTI